MNAVAPQWIEELVDFLRVAPQKKVTLSRDFDPAYTADFVKKKEGAKLLAETVKLALRLSGQAGRAGQ